MAEIAIKLRTGDPLDGSVISVKPNGYLIPPDEMSNWIHNGIEPGKGKDDTINVSEWQPWLQRKVRIQIKVWQYLQTHTAEESAQYRLVINTDIWNRLTTEQKASKIASAAEEQTQQAEMITLACTKGVDTNWGYSTRQSAGLISVPDLTLDDGEMLLSAGISDDARARMITKRLYTFDLSTIITVSKILEWRTPNLYVEVDRTSPINRAALIAAIQDVQVISLGS